MGSFFTSVQLRRPTGAILSRERVALVLGALMAEQGMTPVEDAASADRTMLIELEDDWVSLYDEVCDGQDPRALDQLASALSQAFATHAVTILVHDSDVLELGLFREGERVDRYNSDPSYFEKVGARIRQALAGKPEAWAPLLVGATSMDELREAWADPDAQAEAVLARTAELLGLDRARASLGYTYATKDDPRYVTVRFRHATRPSYETRQEGPPSFENAGYTPELDVSTGSPLEIRCAIRNGGGVGRGLHVVVYGSAVETGLLALDQVELTVGPTAPTSAPFVDRQSADGTPLRVASFPGLEVPAGVDHAAALRDRPPLEKLMELLTSSQIRARLIGRGRAAGVGDLEVGFLVDEPEAQFLHSMSLRSFPPARRPLRARPDVAPHLLRPLQGREQLVAVASLDLPQAEAAKVAVEVFARWIGFFETTEKLRIAVFPADRTKRPRSGAAKRAGFLESARGRKLRAELACERVVSVEGVRLREGGDPRSLVEGFAFGTTLSGPAAEHDPELPTLAVWISVDGTGVASEVRAREASSLARSLMDEVMTAHRGVQALCARWTWRPSSQLDLSPYEAACGVGGSLRRSWLTRFVRGVGSGELWLGGALTAMVPDRAALEAAAVVTTVGDGLRVEIADDPSIDRVEAALAPLLPTSDDWRDATIRAHRRASVTD